MTTKEKLDLLWKYLLLIVLAYGFSQMGSHKRHFSHYAKDAAPHGKAFWFHDGMDKHMDVDVQIEKLDSGDSTIVVKINGEEIDMQGMDLQELENLDADVMVKKMKSGKGETRQIKIIKTITD